MPHKPYHLLRATIFGVVTSALVAGSTLAQTTAPPPTAPPPPPTTTTPPITTTPPSVILPGITITLVPPSGKPGTRTPAPARTSVPGTTRVRTAPVVRKPVYRDVPWPIPRPRYVDGIELPHERPVLSLGRPALLEAQYRDREVLLLIKPAQSEGIADDFNAELVATHRIALLDADMVLLRLTGDSEIDDTVKQLLADERILGAQPNYLFELQQDTQSEPKADPFLSELQYAPRQLSVDRAHEFSYGENTIVAVIDTGVDLSHNEFANTDYDVFDAVERPATGLESHGTAIAGLIAAGHSMTGIAPKAKIKIARAFSEEDGRFLSDSYTIAKALDWAVQEGAQIINMSFAGPADPLLLHTLDGLWEDRSIIVVAAAGNNGPGAAPAYPAAHPYTIAVTATDSHNALYANANRGIYITISAPGVDVIAPAPDNSYEMSSGTSIATAHVTGIIALLMSDYPGLTDEDILSTFAQTAQDAGTPGQDPEFGYGLINAYDVTFLLDQEIGGRG